MLRYVIPVVSKHINPVFVETGTYQGDGVETALMIGFQKVISIEVFEGFFKACRDKFSEDKRVTIVQGDSAVILWDVIKDINEKMTFWLDGHAFPEEDKPLGTASPLLKELEQIARHPIKNHAILIDDMSSLPRGGVYKNAEFDRKDIENAVRSIRGDYEITYFDRGGTDVLVAT